MIHPARKVVISIGTVKQVARDCYLDPDSSIGGDLFRYILILKLGAYQHQRARLLRKILLGALFQFVLCRGQALVGRSTDNRNFQDIARIPIWFLVLKNGSEILGKPG